MGPGKGSGPWRSTIKTSKHKAKGDMQLRFWGTRGSIAVPGPDTLRYGGNTTCVEMKFADGGEVIIDAGTGIRPLGERMAEREGPLEINLLITHLHWDHINGVPFFAPVYRADCHIRVGGWPRGLEGLAGLFDSRRSDGRFPVKFVDLPSRMECSDRLMPPAFQLGQVQVRTIPLHHPQGCVGLRFQDPGGKSLCFITDNELEPGADPPPRLVEFCRGVEIMIHDAQYLPAEMEQRRGWGHSDWHSTLRLAQAAGVRHLVLTHHDPSRSDEQVDDIIAQARYQAGGDMLVEAAYEGMVLSL